MNIVLSILSTVWPWIAGTVATAASVLVVKQIHSATTIGKLKAKDAADQAAFDDLDHLLETAVTKVIHQTAEGIGSKSAAEIGAEALEVLKTLATPQVLADLARVAKVTGEALWPYLLARLTGKAASAKVLTVPANAVKDFDALTPAQKRAAVAALGKV